MTAAYDDEDLIPAEDAFAPPEDDEQEQAGPRLRSVKPDERAADGGTRETIQLLAGAKGAPKTCPENVRWLRSRVGAGPLSWAFRRGDQVVRVTCIGEDGYVEPPSKEDSNGPATVGRLAGLELSTRLADHYNVVIERKADGKKFLTEEWFPVGDCDRVLAVSDKLPYLRPLRGVTHAPLLRAGGGLLTEPGYDDESGLLYVPTCDVPAVPEAPTDAELAEATKLLRGLVADFAWSGPHHEANFLGALLTPLLKLVAPPPYKQVLITARERGSGKSLLADILSEVHGGTLRAWPTDDAELEKVLSSILSQTTAPVAVFDNVRGVLRSARWEALLTAKVYSGRILGITSNVPMANDRLWTLTGNNMKPGGDLDRRSLWVDIDPQCPNPELRTEFKITNLKAHVIEHRGEILAALLTWLAAWDARGRPTPEATATDFGRWIAVVRGVLDLAGVPGTFDHDDSRDREANPDTQELIDFYAAVRDVMGSRTFSVRSLLSEVRFGDNKITGETNVPGIRLAETLPGDVGDKIERAARASAGARTLGKWFSNHAGQWYGGLAVRPTGQKGRDGALWRVMTAAEVDAERRAATEEPF